MSLVKVKQNDSKISPSLTYGVKVSDNSPVSRLEGKFNELSLFVFNVLPHEKLGGHVDVEF